MPRFSLSPVRNGDDDSDSETSRDKEEDLGYSSEDDDDDDEEPLHALGTGPTTRYTLYPEQESMLAYKLRHGYCELYDFVNENRAALPFSPGHYLNGESAPTSALLK